MIPQTDVVVPVHNALPFAKKCISDLYAHTPALSRLIVVDDFSDEETREWLYGPECNGRNPRNTYVRHNSQRWFTRAANTGLRLVETERAVLLNSDTELNDGWLEELYGVWEEFESLTHKRVGLVGHSQDVDTPARWKETVEPGYTTGHCLLLSIQVLQEVSVARKDPGRYFDELSVHAAHINSDRFLNYELNRLGYATVTSFKAAVGHHGFRSWGADLGRVFALKLADLD